MITIKNEIRNTDDWFKAYPPAGGEKQWKEGFSAYEFAKAVLNDGFEDELRKILGAISLKNASFYPERLTYFDDISSGPRHHDLACVCSLGKEKVAICFEAKVKESLDAKLSKAIIDNSKSGKSQKPKRVRDLCQNLFGKKYDSETMSDIYYQMLSGAMGTLAFAYEQNVTKAFFVIYQLVPEKEKEKFKNTISKHKKAINGFVQMIDPAYDINKSSVIKLNQYEIEQKLVELNIVYMEHNF